jgi:hypothetical protein
VTLPLGGSRHPASGAKTAWSINHHIVGAVVELQSITAHREFEADIEKRIINLVS